MVEINEKKMYLRVYTRKVLADSYPDGLARSIHFAVSRDGVWYRPLNKNYGILYAKAEILSDNSLKPRGVREPWAFADGEDAVGIAAVRVCENGEPEHDKGADVLFWRTKDLTAFEECSCVRVCAEAPVERFCCIRNPGEEGYTCFWKDQSGAWYQQTVENIWADQTICGKQCAGTCVPDQGVTEFGSMPEGAEGGNTILAGSGICTRAERYWNPVVHTETRVPETVCLKELDDLKNLRAEAVYSDGSVSAKRVEWELADAQPDADGTFEIAGTVKEERYQFPLAVGYGDPVLFFWEGSWYYISTNDNTDDVGLYVRKGKSVQELFLPETPQHLILDRDEERDFIQTFWAPEFHVIGEDLYLLFAVGGKVWSPQCHLMKLKKGGEIINPNDWEEPIRVRKQDGSWLGGTGITLDMTYLKTRKASYMVWSYREHIGTPKDSGSMLYIARVEEETPWQLASEPVLLSRPLYGWENVSGTINNEGPHGFVRDHKVYLGYSGGSANLYTYAVGFLTADEDADLLCPESWMKGVTPALSFYSVEGEFGPGHHSFYVDEDGELMIAYHAEDALDHSIRCDGIRRVHFDAEGRPRLDLSADQSLNPALNRVTVTVKVEK